MKQNHLTEIIEEQTKRALWEAKNIIDCVPDELWNKEYCEMPCWKHIYHYAAFFGFVVYQSKGQRLSGAGYSRK